MTPRAQWMMSVTRTLDLITAKVTGVADHVENAPPGVMDRVAGLLLGGGALGVLGLAMYLTPDPNGFGTHRQLGLGGCTMLTLTGWPCPMCGMTTTFTLFAHLRPLEATLNQPFGLVLFPLTCALAALGLADAVTAQGALRGALKWIQRRERFWAGVLLFGMIGGWVYKCVRMHPDLLSVLPG